MSTWPRALDFVRQDVGYAGRSIRRAPGFASLVAIALALGIGVNTSAFAVLDELYLRPPAGVSDPGSLRRLWIEHFNPGVAESFFAVQNMSYPVFKSIAQTTEGMATLAAVARGDALQVGCEPTGPRISGAHASSNFFGVVGVRAARGRVYSASASRWAHGRAT